MQTARERKIIWDNHAANSGLIADDDINQTPIYDEEPMAGYMTAKISNIFCYRTRQQLLKQPEIIVCSRYHQSMFQKEHSLDLSAGTVMNVNTENPQSMVAEKADISETIVKVDSQMMIQ
ncbi:hypothetical protein Tco_0002061 [Tanacetum coccineum]